MAPQMMVVVDEKASGTDGGSFTSGSWVTRTLNTVKVNTITGASLSSNGITLPAGTYLIEASAPAGMAVGSHRIRLRNITDSTDDGLGRSAYNYSSDSESTSELIAQVTITGSKAFEIQHRCAVTSASNYAMGSATDWGAEIYTVVKITRLQ